jgi:ribosomal protein S18 acetylase RimI-like enzyme
MIKTRSANTGDLDALLILFEAYRQFYRKKPAPSEAYAFLKKRLQNQDSVIFLAEATSKNIVGFTQLYPSFSSTRMQRLWILNDLYVDPEYRGQGISRLLINTAKDHCKQTKACGILLETETSNTIGNKLYTSARFLLETNNFYFWTNNKDD